MAEYTHEPVLLERVLELLGPALDNDGAVLVDGTLGLGGHTEAVLRRFPGATVLGVDRDEAALERAGERLAGFGARFRAVHAVYDRIPELAGRPVQGVLLDLGVSSMQLDEPRRGLRRGRPAGHADGPVRRPHRRGGAEHLPAR